ncbi:MAG: hypothetical protein HGA67_04345, partial [Candidatus Yonathbacteria bacterium]|nr:hypothetical protein [Candidatus Yonathbacteria bacterium]
MKASFIQRTITLTVLTVFVAVGVFSVARAAFNPQINYQGKLTNTSDVAVNNGNYNIRFRLYTAPSGGSPIWTETLCYSPDSGTTCDGTGSDARVLLTSGLFSVLLGNVSALSSVDFNQTLYLGVEIGGSGSTPSWDGEMTPRKKLGAVPAAFEADKLDGVDSSSFLRSDQADTMSATSASTVLTVTQSGTGDILNLMDGATEVLTVLDGGNVGIGTTNPGAKFQTVSGTNIFSFFDGAAGVTPYMLASSSTAGTRAVGLMGGSSTSGLVFDDGAPFTISADLKTSLDAGTSDGGATLMTILAGGNVGIGATAPGQKLTVDGTFGILEGGSTPSYHTIFQGGDQSGDITYTLPT